MHGGLDLLLPHLVEGREGRPGLFAVRETVDQIAVGDRVQLHSRLNLIVSIHTYIQIYIQIFEIFKPYDTCIHTYIVGYLSFVCMYVST